MSHSHTRLLSLVIILFVFSLLGTFSFQSSAQTRADCPIGSELYGWGWSDTIGWISFNARNLSASGGTYCVSQDSNSNLVGWAWSPNIGWIKFGGLSGFPTGDGASTEGNARISDGKIKGWARACAGTTGKNCATGDRTDGWDGWIELAGTSHQVEWDGSKVLDFTQLWSNIATSGFAWGGEVVGWVELKLSGSPVTPSATCGFTPPVQEGPAGSFTLTWNSSGTASCSSPDFTVTPAGAKSGSVVVNNVAADKIYNMSCLPAEPAKNTAKCSAKVEITSGGGGCVPPNCPGGGGGTTPDPNADLPMWLNKDEETWTINRKVDQSTVISWRTSAENITYSPCRGDIVDATTSARPSYRILLDDELDDLGGVDHDGGEFAVSFPRPGRYEYSMYCETEDIAGTAKNGGGILIINVRETTLEEI